MNAATKLPHWKNALEVFISQGYQPGTVINKSWFMNQFYIADPVTAEDQKNASLEFMTSIEALKAELLETHKIELVCVFGTGYKIVHPREQTRLALITRSRNISREARRMVNSIIHVDTEKLSDAERCEHTDGLAKATSIAAMVSRRKLLGRI